MLVNLYQAYVYDETQQHVHRHARKHDDQPRRQRFGLEPAVFRDRLGAEWDQLIRIEILSLDRELAAAFQRCARLIQARRHPDVAANREDSDPIFRFADPLFRDGRPKAD